MIEKQFENIISMGEGYQAEFKLVLPKKMSQLAEEVCGFANAAGGVIIIGINDDGFPIETKISNAQKSDIQNAFDNINPQLHCKFQHIPYNGVRVFMIEVSTGDNKPYILNGSIYIRIGPSTKKLTSVEQMRDFFQKADKIFFDEVICSGFDINKEFFKKSPDFWIV
jgi:ATP-dependent DNA helicase RecG